MLACKRIVLSPLGTAAVLLVSYLSVGFATFTGRNFDDCSEGLLHDSAVQAVAEGVWRRGGFMEMPKHYQPLPGGERTYYSQFCLHYQVYASGARLWPADLGWYYFAARIVVCALAVCVLAWFVQTVRREVGSHAALTVMLFQMGSFPLILFSTTVYWLEFLLLLPFVFSFALYPRLRDRGWLPLFYLAIGVLIGVKALCGYEYLSSILLSSIVPLVYYEVRDGSGWRPIIVRSFFTFVAGVMGFVAAFAATFRQAWLHLGSPQAGWNAIMQSVHRRTIGTEGEAPPTLTADLSKFTDYFFLHGEAFVLVGVVICFGLFRTLFPGATTGRVRAELLWKLTLFAAFVSSVSWNVLTPGHMRYHRHLNSICFYLPFNLMAYVFAGVLVERLLGENSPFRRGQANLAHRKEFSSPVPEVAHAALQSANGKGVLTSND